VSENKVLRRIFGRKKDEVTGGCRIPHYEELHSLYSLRSIIRMTKSKRMRWAGHIARNAYRILVRKPEGKTPLGRLRRRWVDNIKMELRELEWGWYKENLFYTAHFQYKYQTDKDN
jgi:hypothetical protein